MDNVKNTIQLVNDAAREAVDPMRGFSYQMLRSIEAWLELEDGQFLFLEGAEDLDRLDPSTALVEQIKDTAGSGNITLNSSNTITAISNYWEHCERNPERKISFRYLTTSSVGQERTDKLVLSEPGITTWQAIRKAPSDTGSERSAGLIQKFLATREELPSTMRSWLREASTQSFITKVVVPIEWVTDQPGADILLERIQSRLIELGETRGVDSFSAVNALGELHVRAWKNATDKNRGPLTRGEFVQVLESKGMVPIQKAQLLSLLGQVQAAPSERSGLAQVSRLISKIPRLPKRPFSRPSLERAISEAVDRGTVLIHGSTGMGKTILAAKAVMGRTRVGWVDFRDLPTNAVTSKLAELSVHIEQLNKPCTFVLDDIEVGDDPRALSVSLDRLFTAAEATSCSFLFVAGQRLPPRLANKVDLSPDRIFEAPKFTIDDVCNYLTDVGYSADQSNDWARIIVASTSGHPQLVDARIESLRQNNWPSPSIEGFFDLPSEVVDVRVEARHMVSNLPAEQRELLCRTSLIDGRISRLRLIAIGKIEPGIASPGNLIDRLTGPWLEPTDNSDVRMSPLLRGLAEKVHGQKWCEDMHGHIAWAWLEEKSLNSADVSRIVLHCVLGRKADPLLVVLPSLFDAPKEIWQQIGETLGIISFIGIGKDLEQPFDTHNEITALRVIQLHIASATSEAKVNDIISQFIVEFDARLSDGINQRVLDFIFLWRVFTLESHKFDVQTLFSLELRFMRLALAIRGQLGAFGREGINIAEKWQEIGVIISSAQAKTLVNIDGFENYLNLTASLVNDEAILLIPKQFEEFDVASHILNQMWLSEIRKDNPNWSHFVAILIRAIAFTIDLGATDFARSAAAAVVRVIDENMNDPLSALDFAEKLQNNVSNHPLVLASIAKVKRKNGQLSDAVEIYEQILPCSGVAKSSLPEIFREAAIAYARDQNWSRSAELFGEALECQEENAPIEILIGLRFDLGLAKHKSGDAEGSVKEFSKALNYLIDIDSKPLEEPLLSIRQLGSHAIKIVLCELKSESLEGLADAKSFIGQPSSYNPVNWDQQPSASTALVVHQLISLDLMVSADPEFALRKSEWVKHSRNPLAISGSWENTNKLAAKTLNYEQFIAETVFELSYISHLYKQYEAGAPNFEVLDFDPPEPVFSDLNKDLFYHRVFIAVVNLLARKKLKSLPLEKWHNDLPKHQSYDSLRSFFEETKEVLFGEDDPWTKIVSPGVVEWQSHALVSIGALLRNRTPAQTIIAQAIFARYLYQNKVYDFVALPLADIISDAWEKMCDVPALLVMPKYSVPEIRNAISSSELGWPRIRSVLNAAVNAVPPSTARQIKGHIEALDHQF
ncbi:MAG: hypothetical protein ABJQ21_25400 [Roseibium sp.]